MTDIISHEERQIFQKMLDAYDQQVTKDGETIATLTAQVDALKTELEGWQALGPHLRDENANLEGENRALKAELEQAEEMIEDAVNQACRTDDGRLSHDCISTWEAIFAHLENRGRIEQIKGYLYRWRLSSNPPEAA